MLCCAVLCCVVLCYVVVVLPLASVSRPSPADHSVDRFGLIRFGLWPHLACRHSGLHHTHTRHYTTTLSYWTSTFDRQVEVSSFNQLESNPSRYCSSRGSNEFHSTWVALTGCVVWCVINSSPVSLGSTVPEVSFECDSFHRLLAFG